MTINELRKQFPDEETCRLFFESVMWPSGRVCSHCGSSQSWKVRSESVRDGLYLTPPATRTLPLGSSVVLGN